MMFVGAIVAVLSLASYVSAHPHNNKYQYLLGSHKMTHKDAGNFCKKKGGWLANRNLKETVAMMKEFGVPTVHCGMKISKHKSRNLAIDLRRKSPHKSMKRVFREVHRKKRYLPLCQRKAEDDESDTDASYETHLIRKKPRHKLGKSNRRSRHKFRKSSHSLHSTRRKYEF